MKNLSQVKTMTDNLIKVTGEKQIVLGVLNSMEKEISKNKTIITYIKFFGYNDSYGNTYAEHNERLTAITEQFIKLHWEEFKNFAIKTESQRIAKLSKETKQAMLESMGLMDDEPNE